MFIVNFINSDDGKVSEMRFIKSLGLALLAAVLTGTAFAQPAGVFGGTPTFAQLPGNYVINITASAAGAASATLTTAWPYSATSELAIWSDGESRVVTLAQNATTISWTGNILTGGTGTQLVIDGLTVPPPAGVSGFTTDMGQVVSTGTYWLYGIGDYTPAAINEAATAANVTGCGTLVTMHSSSATTGTIKAVNTSCTPVIPLPYSPTGWWCSAWDITTNTDTLKESATSTNSCTLTGTVVAADILWWVASPVP